MYGEINVMDATPSPHPSGFFFNFIKRILSGHLSITVAVCLSLRHIYCEFSENRHKRLGDIK